jgi:S-formylglutathione hydrolase FrmB
MNPCYRIICVLLILIIPPAALGDEKSSVSAARPNEQGFLSHTVDSPYQSGQTEIRVLLPSRLEDGKRYPVIYVLPVEAGRGNRYGDGLVEVQKHKLHDKHGVIFVAPTFSHLPWYCDHPAQNEIRQETHFLKVVIPFVEKTYPISGKAEDRLLLGFSKSGWGAWSLLLRHPETFGRAAAWDAPLMMAEMGKYGTSEIFSTQENFEKYRLADLLRLKAEQMTGKKRLILTGYGSFREHHQKAHALLDELKIPHEYRDGPSRKHDWHSGWVSEAVELLVGVEGKTEDTESQ